MVAAATVCGAVAAIYTGRWSCTAKPHTQRRCLHKITKISDNTPYSLASRRAIVRRSQRSVVLTACSHKCPYLLTRCSVVGSYIVRAPHRRCVRLLVLLPCAQLPHYSVVADNDTHIGTHCARATRQTCGCGARAKINDPSATTTTTTTPHNQAAPHTIYSHCKPLERVRWLAIEKHGTKQTRPRGSRIQRVYPALLPALGRPQMQRAQQI